MSINLYDKTSKTLTSLASGSRVWVGTKEDYSAQKAAGTLPNNAILYITNDEEDHNHYSTEEVETGEFWIDGRAIYRKTYVRTNNDAFLTSTDIDMVTDYYGMLVYQNGSCVKMCYPSAAAASHDLYTVSGYWDGRDYKFYPQLGSTAISNMDTLYVTLEYVKSSI